MKPGSVIVDLAAETGGNCALTRAGETVVTANGVTILGPMNLPATMPLHASQMFSRNVLTLLQHLISKEGRLAVDLDDEITGPDVPGPRRPGAGADFMTTEALVIAIVIFTLSTFLGVELIGRVPPTLHTPLMSGANAVSGITIVGALIIAGSDLGWISTVSRLHRHRPGDDERGGRLCGDRPDAGHVQAPRPRRSADARLADADPLPRLRRPLHHRPQASRQPRHRAAGQRDLAASACCSRSWSRWSITPIVSYGVIVAGMVVGTALGLWQAYAVKMTAMPQMVALLNGFGGGASMIVGAAEFLRAFEAGADIPTPTGVVMQLSLIIGARDADGQPRRVCQAAGVDAGQADHVSRPRTPSTLIVFLADRRRWPAGRSRPKFR